MSKLAGIGFSKSLKGLTPQNPTGKMSTGPKIPKGMARIAQAQRRRWSEIGGAGRSKNNSKEIRPPAELNIRLSGGFWVSGAIRQCQGSEP
jgi:hypothetical protein